MPKLDSKIKKIICYTLLILLILISIPIILIISVVYREYKPENNRVMKVKKVLNEYIGCDVRVIDTYNNNGSIKLTFKKCKPNTLLTNQGVKNNDILLVNDPLLLKYPVFRPFTSGENVINYKSEPPLKAGSEHVTQFYDSYYYNLILAYQGKELKVPIEQDGIKKIITLNIPTLPLTKEENAFISSNWNVFFHP